MDIVVDPALAAPTRDADFYANAAAALATARKAALADPEGDALERHARKARPRCRGARVN